MIKQIWAKNYRSLADVRLEIEPLTVLVGYNAAGKSNCIDILHFIHDVCLRGLDTALFSRQGFNGICRRGMPLSSLEIEQETTPAITVGIEIETDEIRCNYTFTLASGNTNAYTIQHERCHIYEHDINSDIESETLYEIEDGIWVHQPQTLHPQINDQFLLLPLLGSAPPYSHLYKYLTSMVFYSPLLDGHQMSTLPLQSNHNGAFVDAVRHALPDITDIRVVQNNGDSHIQLVHKIGDEQLPFELTSESDGTLRFLNVLSALYQDAAATLIAIEEPELTIHPGMFKSLWEEIEDVAEHHQILMTTHSPDLLDFCSAGQIRAVEKIDGVTFVGPIEEPQRLSIEENLFLPGELMRAQGLIRAE